MIGFTVGDIDRETEFFAKATAVRESLGFSHCGKRIRQDARRVQRQHAHRSHEAWASRSLSLPVIFRPDWTAHSVPSYSNDEWFEHMAIVVSDMDAAYKILQDAQCAADFRVSHHHPSIEYRGGWHQGDQVSRSGTSRSGIDLLSVQARVICPGRSRAISCFSGLDHTAMTVASTDKSVGFYRDLLGLRVGGSHVQHRKHAGSARQLVQRHVSRHGDDTGCGPAPRRIPRL